MFAPHFYSSDYIPARAIRKKKVHFRNNPRLAEINLFHNSVSILNLFLGINHILLKYFKFAFNAHTFNYLFAY